MIAIVLPTRSLLFTQVLESIEENRKDFVTKLYVSYADPIPKGHNSLTEKALAEGARFIWYVEEDTVPPQDALKNLVMAKADIACIDYAVNGWSCITRSRDTKEILWCGLGCTFVTKEVFQKLEKEYYRVNQSLRLNDWTWIDNPAKYGGQDIWFCMKAREKGFKILQVPGECKHLKLDELGQEGVNYGFHKVSEKPKIEKHQFV